MSDLKQEFLDYITQLQLSETVQKQITEIYNAYTQILGYQLDDIFISEYITSENKRVIDSLWFFNSEYIFEAKEFTSKFFIDAIKNKGTILHWELMKQEYDFKNPTDKSRLTINMRQFETQIGSTFKASGKNCNHLFLIFQKYIQPHLISKPV